MSGFSPQSYRHSLFPARLAFFLLAAVCSASAQSEYFVDPAGDNEKGDGSAKHPWRTISHAVATIPDNGSAIIVNDGRYTGRVRINRRFAKRTVIRAANSYHARIVASGEPVVTVYGACEVELSGFEITREPNAPGLIVVHVQSTGGQIVENIVLRDNIIHDSYNNDLLKINNGARNVLVEGNIFYNQSGPDEHIDINGVTDVTVRDNIFFNDFLGSGRPITNLTSSYIVIKNSAELPENKRIQVRRNVFLNWQGSPGAGFLMIGEDGKLMHEAEEVLIENNLMLGNAMFRMRAPLNVKGGKNITFRNNTISGFLPATAFAARLTAEGSNPPNENIQFYNNVWSSPAGMMRDLLDGSRVFNNGVVLSHNLYWNGGRMVPIAPVQMILSPPDPAPVTTDPKLRATVRIVLPRWTDKGFPSGSRTIRQEFERLVNTYAVPAAGSPVVNRGKPGAAPADDILGRPRDPKPDIGAIEIQIRPR